MDQFVLTCCSTADRSKEFFEERNIPYVCFHYRIGEEEFLDDLGKTISFEQFYENMKNGATPETSQVNIGEFIEFWEPIVREGKDILHISLSSGISGAYNSANIASEELMERYPERTIKVVDSLNASSGYGLFVEYLADMRDQGKTLEEVYEWALNNRLYMNAWFFSTDLTSYKRGGRISATSAFIGTVLSICPLLNINNAGKLIPREKIRTKRKVIREIVNKMEEHAKDGTNYTGRCAICYSACLEDAKEVKALIEEKFPHIEGEIRMNSIGTVIGSHTGPGTVALFFMGDERME